MKNGISTFERKVILGVLKTIVSDEGALVFEEFPHSSLESAVVMGMQWMSPHEAMEFIHIVEARLGQRLQMSVIGKLLRMADEFEDGWNAPVENEDAVWTR